jgi:hypothetical protein
VPPHAQVRADRLESDFDEHLTKPVELDALLRVLGPVHGTSR